MTKVVIISMTPEPQLSTNRKSEQETEQPELNEVKPVLEHIGFGVYRDFSTGNLLIPDHLLGETIVVSQEGKVIGQPSDR